MISVKSNERTLINAFIIDDSASARTLLSNMLQKYCPDVLLSGIACNYQEAMTKLPILSEVDILFIDVELGGNRTGFDILNMLDFKGNVVFVTAYEEHALKAFKYDAANYLMKPISPGDLEETIQRIRTKMVYTKSQTILRLQPLKNLPVYNAGRWELILIEHIVYIQANGSYSNIHVLNTSKPYIASKPIKYFEERLYLNNEFVRIQKSYIINKRFIRSFSKSDYTIELIDQANIPVGGGTYRNILKNLIER